MESYLQYQQLLSENIQDATIASSSIKEKFEEQLGQVKELKDEIERVTDGIGGILGVKPIETIGKVGGRLLKKTGQGIADQFKEGIKSVKEEAQEKISPTETTEGPSEGRVVEFDNPLYDPDTPIETPEMPTPAEVPTSSVEIHSFGDILNDRNLFKRYVTEQQPELAESGGDEGIEQARIHLRDNADELDLDLENPQFVQSGIEPEARPGATSNRIGQLLRENENPQIEQPSNNNTGPNAGESASSEVTSGEQSAQDAVVNSAGEVASSAENTGKAIAENALKTGGTDALEDVGSFLGDLFLDIDPFTFLFGAVATAATIGAGIAGADSVKNPSIPTPPKIAQASTQFGF